MDKMEVPEVLEILKHATLSQWELALLFSVAVTNKPPKHFNRASFLDVVKALVYHPEKTCLELENCNHGCWLLCQLLCRYEDGKNENVAREAELKLILQNLNFLHKKSLTEIHIKYCQMLDNDQEMMYLSEDCLEDLSNGLLKKPIECSFILNKLLSLQKDKIPLCDFYTQCLGRVVYKLKAIELKEETNLEAELKQTTLCLVNLLREESFENLNKDTSPTLNKIFENFFTFINQNLFSKRELYAAVFGRDKPTLTKFYQTLEDTHYWRLSDWNAVDRGCLFGGISSDGKINFEELFLHMAKCKIHFLEGIMNSSVDHILNGRVNVVLKNFSGSWFGHLLPLVLNSAWQACTTDREANNVLSVINEMVESNTNDEYIKNLERLFKSNLYATEWCASKWSDVNGDAETIDILSKKRNIFSCLQSNSTLCVIHKFIGLRNLNECDVLKFLCSDKNDRGFESKKQEQIFRGYLVLTCIMDAIYYSICLEQFSTPIAKLQCNGVEMPFDRSSELRNYLNKEGYLKTYEHFIVENFLLAKTHLDEIESVALKVELMENIFSLIFLTHNDVQSPYVSQDESDEGHVGIDVNSSIDKPPFNLPSLNQDNSGPGFTYSTESLKDNRVRSKSDSYQGSSQSSSGSSQGGSKLGFLCNETILKDLINWLSKAFLDTKNLVYQEFGLRGVEANTEIKDADSFAASKSKNDIQKRLSKLSVFITEAQWRFELLSHDIADPLKTSPKSPERHVSFVVNGKHKKRKKKSCQLILTDNSKTFSLGIFHKMLASPEALLKYSLIHHNLKQANHVVQIFNLQKTYDGGEAIFSLWLPELITKLNSNRQDIKAKGNDSIVLSLASSTLESANEINLIEKHFEEFPNPKLKEIDNLSSQTELPSSQILVDLLNEAKDTDLAVLCDVAYSTGFTPERIENILSIALRKANPEAQSLIPSHGKMKKHICMKGISKFAKQIYEYVSKISSSLKMEGNNFSPCYCYEKSRSKSIFYAIGPLDAKSVSKNIETWKSFNYQFDLLSKMLSEEEGTCVTLLNGEENERRDADLLHSAFLRFTKLNSQDMVQFPNDKSDKLHFVNYLDALYTHVKEVANVLVKCAKNWVLRKSYFSVLDQSPTMILSGLLLQNSLPLKELEDFAKQMHQDLVHVITQTCCPQITNLAIDRKPNNLLHRTSLDISLGISDKNPVSISITILSEIIAIIKENSESKTAPNLKKTIALCHHPKVSQWIDSCSVFEKVDLEKLTTQEDKLAFFINTSNALWILAILTDLKQNSELNIAENISCISEYSQLLSTHFCERIIKQCDVKYHIGQLGFVSLFTLKYWLLIKDSHLPKYLEDSPLSHLINVLPKSVKLGYLPTIEPRCIFVLNECFLSSPKLQILNPANVTNVLNEAMVDYLSSNVKADHQTVWLPELVTWHYMVFAAEDPNHSAPFEGLLTFIASHVDEDLKIKLNNLLSMDLVVKTDDQERKTLPFQIEVTPFNYEFGLSLQDSKPKKLNTSNLSTSISSLNSRNSTPSFELPEYVEEYVSSRCSLVFDLLVIIKETRTAKDVTDFRQPKFCDKEISHYPLREQLVGGKLIQVLRGDSQSDTEWIQALLSPKVSNKYIWNQTQSCLDAKKYKLALEILEGSDLANFPPDKELFRDLLLCHLASQHPCLQFPDPWSYSLKMSSIEFKVQSVLECLKYWPDHACLETLQACLHSIVCEEFPTLHQVLKLKIEEFLSYGKAIKVLNKNDSFQPKITTWQQVKNLADTDIESLIRGLESQPKILFDCLRFCCVPESLKMFIMELHIVSLLEEIPPNTLKVKEKLEELEEPNRNTLMVNLLTRISDSSLDGRQFIVDYILENYPSYPSITELKKLKTGIKMMSCFHWDKQKYYIGLVNEPSLIFEQLVMNIELETAAKVLEVVYKEDECLESFDKESASLCFEKYAEAALEYSVVDTLPDPVDTVSIAPSTGSAKGDQFVMPDKTPSKENWVPDNATTTCMVCGTEHFSMFLRRHHCRRCGRVVTSNCSQNSMIVAGYNNIPVRVCDNCYEQTTHTSFFSPGTSSERYPKLAPENVYSISPNKMMTRNRSSTLNSFKTTLWLLSTDPDDLEAIREEFCYEQAPSVPLCLSILELHNDPQRCAKYILTLSDILFQILTPRSSGKVNPEVDYTLVLSMMRMLLLSAKVKFLEAKDESGVEYYEIYDSRLDLVNLLIKNDCAHLIPKEGINSNDIVRRIRDQLLEEERMTISFSGDQSKFDINFESKQDRKQHSLALEVSTKFGLDTSVVFGSWGMLCLKVGDWIGARDKFLYCLQKPKDLNQSQQESPMLEKIISILETSSKGSPKVGTIITSLESLKNIQNGLTNLKPKDEQNHVLIEECAYYLNKYGSHMSIVTFYQKYGMFTEALKYIQDKSCDSDVFFNGLCMPCIKVAQLGVLLRQLQSIDATLEKWWPFLMATCFQLHQQKLYHVLHKIQLFMEDYIRSGMTSIRFYQAPARDYSVLFERLHYLTKAKHNFENYLKHKGNDSNPKKKILKLALPVVQGHLETLLLQTEITRFLYYCEENCVLSLNLEEVEREVVTRFPKEAKPTCPPTLFDSKARKTALTIALFIFGMVELEGLNLGAKIIQSHQLDGDQICSIMGHYVIKMNKTSEVANLVTYLRQSVVRDKLNCDEMIQSCIQILSSMTGKSREIEVLIKLLNNDISKINCYIMCNKLKSAYLLAIRLERVYDIRRIQTAAVECGQDSVASICEKWLQHKERMTH